MINKYRGVRIDNGEIVDGKLELWTVHAERDNVDGLPYPTFTKKKIETIIENEKGSYKVYPHMILKFMGYDDEHKEIWKIKSFVGGVD